MKEKLLAALRTKFAGVQDAILDRVAEKYAKTVTEESQVQTVIDGVTFQQVLESYGDSRATEATTTSVSNYEKKHGIKDGKPITTPPATPPAPPAPPDMPEWAKTLLQQNKELQERLDGQDKRTTQEKLSATLKQRLKDKKIPDAHIATLTAGRVLNEESEIDTLVTEIESAYTTMKQEIANEVAPAVTPGLGNTPTSDTQLNGALDSWRTGKGLPKEVQANKN